MGIEGKGWDEGGEDRDWGDNDLIGDESIGEGSIGNLFGNSVVLGMEELMISVGRVDGAVGGMGGVDQNESSLYLLSPWRGILVKNVVFSKKATAIDNFFFGWRIITLSNLFE